MKKQLSFQLTWTCDIACKHCCQDHTRLSLDVATARKTIDGFYTSGLIDSVGFSGGEVFEEYEALVALTQYCHRYDLPVGLVTNANWARTYDVAYRKLEPLVYCGLKTVCVSYDAYHAQFVPYRQVLHALEAAQTFGL